MTDKEMDSLKAELIMAMNRGKDMIYVSHLKSVKTAWGTMLKNAGIKDYRIHDLRHQGASICVENGESLYIVSKMLGHKSQRTTERYAYLSKTPIQKATELLADVVDF